jgi:hypothetical protein
MADLTENKKRRGRPLGTPGGGRYGCKTKVVRVPETVADNIVEILASFEAVKELVDHWEDKLGDSAEKSKYGKPSPRYQKAIELLEDLRSLLGE